MNANESKALKSISFEKTTLFPGPFDPQARASETGEIIDLSSQRAFRSIGYKSEPLPGLHDLGVPFDEARGIIPNDAGGRLLGAHRTDLSVGTEIPQAKTADIILSRPDIKEKMKHLRDLNAPKRPLTPFFIYMKTASPIIAADLDPGVPKKVIGSEGVRRWKEMVPSDRQLWVDVYTGTLKLYNARVHAYEAGNMNAKDMTDDEAAHYAELINAAVLPGDERDLGSVAQMTTRHKGDLLGDIPTAAASSEASRESPKVAATTSIHAAHVVKRTFNGFVEKVSAVETSKEETKEDVKMPRLVAPSMIFPLQLHPTVNSTQPTLITMPTELLLPINDNMSFHDVRALHLTSHYFCTTVPPPKQPLLNLPTNLHLMIADYLRSPFYEIWALRQTCRHFRNIISPLKDIPSLFKELLDERSDELETIICQNVKDSAFSRICNLTVRYGWTEDYATIGPAGEKYVLWQCKRCGALKREEADEEIFCWKCPGDDGEKELMEIQRPRTRRISTAGLSPSPLLTLPVELHLLINSHLPFYDVYIFRMTSHYFRTIIPPLKDIPSSFAELLESNKDEYRDVLMGLEESIFATECNVVIRDMGNEIPDCPLSKRFSVIPVGKEPVWLVCDNCGAQVRGDFNLDIVYCWKCGGWNILMELKDLAAHRRIELQACQ